MEHGRVQTSIDNTVLGDTPVEIAYSGYHDFGGRMMTDGRRMIEVHQIAGRGHNDAFAMAYLPAEKILIEVDADATPAANAPPPASPNPFAVNLYENIQRLKLDVRQIAVLHGPRRDLVRSAGVHRSVKHRAVEDKPHCGLDSVEGVSLSEPSIGKPCVGGVASCVRRQLAR